MTDCLEAHGKRPAAYLDELGFLGPRTLLAHGVWLDEAELELIAERGATVVTNPAANMKLAVGRDLSVSRGGASWRRRRAGHRRRLLELQPRHVRGGEALRPGPEARQRRPLDAARRSRPWRSRAGMRSPMLGGTRLDVGQPADFLLLRSSDPELSAGDLDADLVYAASGSVVDTTVVAGRVLMRDRVVPARRRARRGGPLAGGSPHRRADSVPAAMRTKARFPESRRRPGTTRAST